MQQHILDEMWKRKSERKEVFAIGILNKEAMAIEYPMDRFDKEKGIVRHIPVGTQVMITMISRFGDVGIRDYDIGVYQHGYNSRVDPSTIDNVEFIATSNGLGQ